MIATGQDTETKKAEAKKLLESFCTQGDVLAWVATRRHLHEFSFGNQLLLQLQLHARFQGLDLEDAGFEHPYPVQAAWRWRESGFWPQKTQLLPEPLRHAMWVWAPHTKKKNADGTWKCPRCHQPAAGPRCPSGHTREKVFILKPVFSRLQVVDEEGGQPPLPPAGEPLTGDSHDHLFQPLLTWGIEELGLNAIYDDTPDEDLHLNVSGGYYDAAANKIVVRRGPPNEMVATLVHELAHACGITYKEYDRGQAEAIVETAAYLACQALGLNIAGRSLAYVAGWAGAEGEEPWQAVQRHLKTIDTLARRLEKAAAYTREQDEEEAA